MAESKVWYHKYNYLKARILMSLYRAYQNETGPMTAQQIADDLGIERQRVSDILCKWHARKYKYTKRLDKKAPGGNGRAYLYVITKYGLERLTEYKERIRNHQDLNLLCKAPKEISSYFGITAHGQEVGLSVEGVIAEMDTNKRNYNNRT